MINPLTAEHYCLRNTHPYAPGSAPIYLTKQCFRGHGYFHGSWATSWPLIGVGFMCRLWVLDWDLAVQGDPVSATENAVLWEGSCGAVNNTTRLTPYPFAPTSPIHVENGLLLFASPQIGVGATPFFVDLFAAGLACRSNKKIESHRAGMEVVDLTEDRS